MGKYIDAEKLIKAIEEKGLDCSFALKMERLDTLALIDSLQQEQTDMGEVSDGYHTFNELYYYRMLYNAAFFNLLPKEWVHKSKRHHNGEECFGGGWFIVMANLPTGQVSNHYELKDWDLFKLPEKEFADEWDGHTPQEAAERLHKYLQQEHPETDEDDGKFVKILVRKEFAEQIQRLGDEILAVQSSFIRAMNQQEQPEIELEAEIEMEWDSFNKHLVKYDNGSEEVVWLNRFSFVNIANYFYKLGLKAK